MSNSINELLELKVQIGKILNYVKHPERDELLTSTEVMKMLKISRNSYNRLKNEGIIKVYLLRGKLYSKYSEIMTTIEGGQIN